MRSQRFLAKVLAGTLAIALTACGGGGSPGSVNSTSGPSTESATALAPDAEPTASASIALPASDATGIVIDTGLTDPPNGGFHAGTFLGVAVAAGKLWLGSPNGLVQIDPATNTATIVDREPGASVSVAGNVLWRSAYFHDTIRRTQLDTMQPLGEIEIPDPLNLLATENGTWVSQHDEGILLKLDPDSGATVAATTVSTPGCCGAAELVELDGHLFVMVNKDRKIVEVDEETGAIVATHELPSASDYLRYAGGAWWTSWWGGTADPEEQALEESDRSLYVQRVDSTTFASRKITVGAHPGAPGDVDGEAWVPVGDTLVELDSSTGAPVRVVRLNIDGFDGGFVIEALGSVWVYGKYDSRVVRLRPEDLQ